MVHAFLRESGRAVQTLSPAAQAQTLSQVRRQLRDELRRLPEERVEDEELSDLLNRLRATTSRKESANGLETVPANRDVEPGVPHGGRAPQQAEERTEVRRKSRHPFASSRREWLGVCLGLAEQSGLSPVALRAGFLVGGILTGPLAVLVYLGLYLAEYRRTREDVPPIDRARVGRLVGGTAAVLGALLGVTAAGLWAVDFAYVRVLDQALDPGVWGNFRDNFPMVSMGAALVFLPVAGVASLPLANDWDETLAKVIRAALALFALLLALGFASYLAGALITAAQTWAA